MDINEHCLCPKCKEPMMLTMPIWVRPGDEYIDTGNIDWDADNKQDSNNWWCHVCNSHHFPLDNES